MKITRRVDPLPLLITFVWLGFLIYLASIPRHPHVPALSRETAGDLAHYISHLVLAAAIYLSVRPGPREPWYWVPAFLVAVAASTAVSVGIEYLQTLVPGRGPALSDILYGGLGTLTGVMGVMFLEQLRVSRRLLSWGMAAGVALLIMMVSSGITMWDRDLLPVLMARRLF